MFCYLIINVMIKKDSVHIERSEFNTHTTYTFNESVLYLNTRYVSGNQIWKGQIILNENNIMNLQYPMSFLGQHRKKTFSVICRLLHCCVLSLSSSLNPSLEAHLTFFAAVENTAHSILASHRIEQCLPCRNQAADWQGYSIQDFMLYYIPHFKIGKPLIMMTLLRLTDCQGDFQYEDWDWDKCLSLQLCKKKGTVLLCSG